MFIGFYQSPDSFAILDSAEEGQEHRSKIFYTSNVTVYPRLFPRDRKNWFIKDELILGLRLGLPMWVKIKKSAFKKRLAQAHYNRINLYTPPLLSLMV